MVGILTLFLVGVVLHLDIRTQVEAENAAFQPRFLARVPVHPPDPEMTEEHPSYREMSYVLEQVRSLESSHPIPPEWKLRLKEVAVSVLYLMELIVLDVGETSRVRCFLLEVLTQFQEEAMRQFLFRIFSDSREDPEVRKKALESIRLYVKLPAYRDRTVQELLILLSFET
ncbi:MAG: hypothetical protein QF645_09760, partial [Planctomycetota bacterium]|nr:hypothetical protein [Planctomycetota bacterium]